jgi:predicted dehydrogenase
MASIRVALLGYGLGGRVFHAPLISSIPEFELVTIVSSRREEILAAYPQVAVSTDAEAAMRAADLVVVSTPDETHTRLARAALELGKDVVVDKPFTQTLEQARELAALAEAKGRFLSVYQNRRWDGDFLGARAVIASGALGRVTQFESRFDRFRTQVKLESWREQKAIPAGLWFDIGAHLADQAIQLFGVPLRAQLFTARMREQAIRDDWFHAVLQYRDVQVTLHSSTLVAGEMPRFAIHGTEGSWIKYGLDPQEPQAVAGMARTDPAFGVESRPALLWRDGKSREVAVPRGDHGEYYRLVRDALVHGAPNPVPPSQALANMELLTAAAATAAG